MSTLYRKNHELIKIINNSVIDLPAPCNLSIWWNMGSMLGLCLVIQILTGLFLSMHYESDTTLAFSSVAHIMRDVNYGWLLRSLHTTGASVFFICLYLHIGRGIYYGSYTQTETWNIGVVLLLLSMATAFLGYVLPWGQMSFWGATVITNLLSAIPYIGGGLVQWLWGGFSIDNATLVRFFAFHFILPFIICAFSLIHLLFLHSSGSNNPLGYNSDYLKVPFHPYYTLKDICGFCFIFVMLGWLVLFTPNLLGDPDNFIPANPLVTPPHIKPEWYFLWAYAILRSVPNKLGGVIMLFLAVLILFILPVSFLQSTRGNQFNMLSQVCFWVLISDFFLLTWVGMCPVEAPYVLLGQITSSVYFLYYMMTPIICGGWSGSLYFFKGDY